MKIKAHAKINLGLQVLGKNRQNTHELVSLLAQIPLADTLHFRHKVSGQGRLSVVYRTAFLPKVLAQDLAIALGPASLGKKKKYRHDQNYDYSDKKNDIIARCYYWLIEKGNQFYNERECFALWKQFIRQSYFQISVRKKIPSPSGLGGASSDAASFIWAFLQSWHHYAGASLAEVALQSKTAKQSVGSDPFTKKKPLAAGSLILKEGLPAVKEFTDFIVDNCYELGHDLPFFFVAAKQAILLGSYQSYALESPLAFSGFLFQPSVGFSTANMYSQLKKPLQADSFFFSIYWRCFKTLQKLGLMKSGFNPAVARRFAGSEFFENLGSSVNIQAVNLEAGSKAGFSFSLKDNFLRNDFQKALHSNGLVGSPDEKIDPKVLTSIEMLLGNCRKYFLEKLLQALLKKQGLGRVAFNIAFDTGFDATFQQRFERQIQALLSKAILMSMSGSGSAFYVVFVYNRVLYSRRFWRLLIEWKERGRSLALKNKTKGKMKPQKFSPNRQQLLRQKYHRWFEAQISKIVHNMPQQKFLQQVFEEESQGLKEDCLQSCLQKNLRGEFIYIRSHV